MWRTDHPAPVGVRVEALERVERAPAVARHGAAALVVLRHLLRRLRLLLLLLLSLW